MDLPLRCNSMSCRKQLTDQAVVTTCSHIFCVPCSGSLNGNAQHANHRVCPACQAELKNPDDATLTMLNPTEDYKTSVLSGLNPSIIVECAGRALSFWAYQTTQELAIQEHRERSLTDRYNTLDTEMNNIIHEANTTITSLQKQLTTLQLDQESIKKKHHDLLEAFREKSRKHNQTQELYDKLKRRTLLSHVKSAASNSVDQALHDASARSNRHADLGGDSGPSYGSSGIPLPQRQRPILFPTDDFSKRHERNLSGNGGGANASIAPPGRNFGFNIGSASNDPGGQRSRGQSQTLGQTPSSHRQRLPVLSTRNGQLDLERSGLRDEGYINRRMTAQSPKLRQPLSGLNGNHLNGFGSPGVHGYGLSGRAKVGSHDGTSMGNVDSGHARLRTVRRTGLSGATGTSSGPLNSRTNGLGADGGHAYPSVETYF